MTEQAPPAPVIISLALEDAALADRLASILAGIAGIRLAAPGETADVVLRAAGLADGGGGDTTLTPREQEVLALLAEGASNKVIALRLGISVHTAKFRVGCLLDKLDATGRTDAVAHAARLGVLHL